jgi:hypothetical protein
MVFKEFIEYSLQFLIEAVFHIISFILCWGMNIQNNDMKPATAYHDMPATCSKAGLK